MRLILLSFFVASLGSRCTKLLTKCVESATNATDFEFCANLKNECDKKQIAEERRFDQFHSKQFRFEDQISENQALPALVSICKLGLPNLGVC